MRLQREDLAGRKCQHLPSPGATSAALLIQKPDIGASRKKPRLTQKTAARGYCHFGQAFPSPRGARAVLNGLLSLSPASNNSLQHGLSRLILDLNWEVTGRLQEGGLLAKRRLSAMDFVHIKCQKECVWMTFGKPSSNNQVAEQIRLWDLRSWRCSRLSSTQPWLTWSSVGADPREAGLHNLQRSLPISLSTIL